MGVRPLETWTFLQVGGAFSWAWGSSSQLPILPPTADSRWTWYPLSTGLNMKGLSLRARPGAHTRGLATSAQTTLQACGRTAAYHVT